MRRELKYVLPVETLPALRDAIAPYMELDPFCRPFEGRGYTVRSIYLDSPTLLYYREKRANLQNRKKIRVRGYNEPADDAVVFLEIKRKFGDAISKDRARAKYEKLGALFECGRFEPPSALRAPSEAEIDAGRRVFYYVHRENLGPTSLVVYEREAFLGRFDRTFRITLDRNLRGALYPDLEDLFREDGLREAMRDTFIMEVKYDTHFPTWMRHVIARFNLLRRPASKYCICVDLFDRRHDSKAAVLAQAPPVLARGGVRRGEKGLESARSVSVPHDEGEPPGR